MIAVKNFGQDAVVDATIEMGDASDIEASVNGADLNAYQSNEK